MDFKKNEKGNIVPQPNSSDNQNYFTESNAGHISVQTISPFRMRGSEFATEQSLKFNTDRCSNILGKKLPKDACSSTTSKLLIKQIIREHNLEGDSLLKEGHVEMNRGRHRFEKKCNYNQSFLINHVEFKHSTPTINSKHSSMQLGLCSREETIVPAVDAHSQCTYLERRIYTSDSLYSTQTIEQKQYTEKATYCRPVLNFNTEFVNKTREKNIRLQQLVKQLVLARKREKETEALNNYINELKSRHGIDGCDQEGNNLPQNQHKCQQVDCNSNCCKTTLNRSSKCNEILEEFYSACEAEGDSKCSCPHYDNTYQCYPMSSQGRFMILKKQKRINPFSQDWQYQTPRRPFHGNTIVVDREKFRSRQEVPKASTASLYRMKSPTDSNKVNHGTDNLDNNYEQRYKEFGTQTNKEIISSNQELMLSREEIFIKDTLQEQYSRVSENVDRLKRKIQETVQRDGTSVLKSIENKLDTLITALNSYIQEPRPETSEEQCYHCHSLNFNRNQFKFHNMNLSRSDTFGLIKTERLMCGLLAEKATKPIPYSTLNRIIAEKPCATDINKFLIGERENSNKVQNNIKNMLDHNTLQRSVQISLDIPTNERSTEVTNSLSKSFLRFQDRSVSIAKISSDGSGDDGRMAIAVNTDPLGLLALLKISSDTVKQYLSYMPNFPYHSYLQMIQFPQTRQNPNFVCNICGAAFERPSQLSDHIQGHDLGRTRDCCVCRHMLDMASQRPLGLFRCQYCGQRFTRAYCCELHQETCAKRFGLKHDINPSLMLLR